MKKILFVVLAILLSASVAFAAPDPTHTRGTVEGPGAVGEIRGNGNFPSECYRTFRLVRYANCNANDMHISPDNAVIWDTVSDDGVTVMLSTTSADSRVAGVAVSHILTADAAGNTAAQDIGRRNWGYIQTYGLCQVSLDECGGFLVGNAIALGNLNPGKVTGYAGSGTIIEIFGSTDVSADIQGVMGFAMDTATTSSNNAEVFLKGLD